MEHWGRPEGCSVIHLAQRVEYVQGAEPDSRGENERGKRR